MDEFYRLNPKKIIRYQPYMMARYKAEKDQESEVGWVNGQYVARAINVTMSKNGKYPTEPITFYQEYVSEEEMDQKAAEDFWAYAQAYNKAHEYQFDTVSDASSSDVEVVST